MYIPNFNIMPDKTEIVEFMQRFSFATIITAKDDFPVATHLPFLVTVKDDNIILSAHFAKANNQWKDMEKNPVLVIFSEPHAYISPKNYDKLLNVPTWNYISVHAYGRATLVTEYRKTLDILQHTINAYDSTYMQQWDNLQEEYKNGMIKGIVAFEVLVTELEGKKKLSQNKTPNEQQKIINALSASEDENERIIAEYMRKNLERGNR